MGASTPSIAELRRACRAAGMETSICDTPRTLHWALEKNNPELLAELKWGMAKWQPREAPSHRSAPQLTESSSEAHLKPRPASADVKLGASASAATIDLPNRPQSASTSSLKASTGPHVRSAPTITTNAPATTRSFALSASFEAQLSDAVRACDPSDAATAGVLGGYLATLRKHMAAHKTLCASAQQAQRRAETKLSSMELRERSGHAELLKLREENRKLRWKTGTGSVTQSLLRAAKDGQKKTMEEQFAEALADGEALRAERDEYKERVVSLERELKASQVQLDRSASMKSAYTEELSVLRETQKSLHRQVDETAVKALRTALSQAQATMKNLQMEKDEAVAASKAAAAKLAKLDEKHDKALRDLRDQVANLEWQLHQVQVEKQEKQVAESAGTRSNGLEEQSAAGLGDEGATNS